MYGRGREELKRRPMTGGCGVAAARLNVKDFMNFERWQMAKGLHFQVSKLSRYPFSTGAGFSICYAVAMQAFNTLINAQHSTTQRCELLIPQLMK